MTEEEWLTGRDILRMIHFTNRPLRKRKSRLLLCACFGERQETLTDETCKKALEAAERYADGLVTLRELVAAKSAATPAALEQGCGWVLEVANEFEWVGMLKMVHGIEGRVPRAVRTTQLQLLRDLFGNPFHPVALDPSWRTPTVTALAQTTYDSRRFGDLPVLADALEEAGCPSAELLDHLRGPGPHARGCWAIDLILGKS